MVSAAVVVVTAYLMATEGVQGFGPLISMAEAMNDHSLAEVDSSILRTFLDSLRQRSELLETRIAASESYPRSQADLMRLVTEVSRQQGVRLESLRPTEDPEKTEIVRCRLTIEARGAFGKVGWFLESLEKGQVSGVISKLNLTRADDSKTDVHASFDVEFRLLRSRTVL